MNRITKPVVFNNIKNTFNNAIVIVLLLLINVLNADNSNCNQSFFIDNDVDDKNVLEQGIANRTNLNEFNLFSHGRSGELLINGEWKNAEAIANFLNSKFNIQNSTVSYLNIYGCEFAKGENGKQAVAYLENTLGLQVNASTNITGAAGDWILEVGNVETSNFTAYQYNLQVANTGPDDDYDGDNVINSDDLDDDNDGILDTVECPELVTNLVSDGGFAGTQAEVNASGWYASTSASNFETTTAPVSTYSSTNHNSTLTGGLFDELGSNNANTGLKNVLHEYNSFTNAIVYDYGLLNQGELEYSFDLGTRATGSSREFVVQVWDADNDVVVSTIEQDAFNTLPDYNASPAFKNFSGTVTLPQTGNYYLLFRGTGISSFVDDYLIDRVASRYSVPTCDLDNDGIPNHLDLDSDGDGCPDALEGSGTYVFDDLVSDSNIDGGNVCTNCEDPVQLNLGDSSNTDGTPNLVGDTSDSETQGVGNSQSFGTNTDCCSNADDFSFITDADNDGIGDDCDLDDDNDGILDEKEQENCEAVGIDNSNIVNSTASGTTSTTLSNGEVVTSSMVVSHPNLVATSSFDGYSSGVVRTRFSGPNLGNTTDYFEVSYTFDKAIKVQLSYPGPAGTGSHGTTDVIQLIVSSGGFDINNPNNNSINVTENSATQVTFSPNSGGNDVELEPAKRGYTVTTSDAVTSVKLRFKNTDTISNYVSIKISAICVEDKDNDGIPNHLDLDSDGDGCPDAIEGGGSFDADDLETSTIPGGNSGAGYNGIVSTGVQQNLGTDSNDDGTPNVEGTMTTDSETQTIGDSQTGSTDTECCNASNYPAITDSDSDGIGDGCDLDDDNDGILDTDEGYCEEEAVKDIVFVLDQSGSISTTEATDMVNGIKAFLAGDIGSGRDISFVVMEDDNVYGEEQPALIKVAMTGTSVPASITTYLDNWLAVANSPAVGRDYWASGFQGVIQHLGADLGPNYEVIALTDGNSSSFMSTRTAAIPILNTGAHLFAIGPYDQAFGATPTVGEFQAVMDATYGEPTQEVTDYATDYETSEFDFVPDYSGLGTVLSTQLGVALCKVQDTDNDGIADYLDLDSDGDGCPDAIEGGGSFDADDLETSTIPGGNSGAGYNGIVSTGVQQNLGTDSNDDGTPNVEGTMTTDSETQTIGDSRTRSKETECCKDAVNYSYITDTDGDGIGDACDLDDDNDGILDTDEGYCEAEAVKDIVFVLDQSGSITTTEATDMVNGIKAFLAGDIGSGRDISFVVMEDDNVYGEEQPALIKVAMTGTSVPASITTYLDNWLAVANSPAVGRDYWASGFQGVIQHLGAADLGPNYEVIVLTDGNSSSFMSTRTAAIPILNTGAHLFAIGPYDQAFGATPTVEELQAVMDATYGEPTQEVTDYATDYETSEFDFVPDYSGLGTVLSTQLGVALCKVQDTDNDGIADYLDLDSDGDGCPDAIEGGGSFDADDLETSTIPGGNSGAGYNGIVSTGVQQNLGTDSNDDGTPNVEGTMTTDSETQTIGDSRTRSKETECCKDAVNYSYITDTDGDNIGDDCDLDDDNDGILDTEEDPCVEIGEGLINADILTDGTLSNGVSAPTTWGDQNVSGGSLPNTSTYNGAASEITGTSINLTPGSDGAATLSIAGGNVHLVNDPTQEVTDVFGVMFEFDATPGGTITYTNVYDHLDNQLLTLSDLEFYGIGYGYNPSVSNPSVLNITNPSPGVFVVEKPGSEDRVFYRFRAINGNFLQRFDAELSEVAPGDFIAHNISRKIDCISELDTDDDGIPNRLDLDSDGDGCPDAIEGAGDFTADNLSASTMPGGNSTGDAAYTGENGAVTDNLTGSPVADGAVGDTGIPLVVDQEQGQGIGSSQIIGTIEVTTQPEDQSICEDALPGTVTFNAEATATPTDGLVWQWEMMADGETEFTEVSGAAASGTGANASLTVAVSNVDQNNTQYQAVFTSTAMQCPVYSDPVFLIVIPKPVSEITDRSFCVQDDPTQIVATPSGGTFGGGTFITSEGVFDPQAAGLGDHTITYNYTSLDGCVAEQVTETITVSNNPEINAQSNPTCINSGVQTLQVSPAGGTFSGPGVNATTGEFNPATAGIGTHTVYYSVVSTDGCSGSNTLTMIVRGEPAIQIPASGPYCLNDEAVQLSASPTGGTYSGTGVSESGVFNPATAGVGTHTITYTIEESTTTCGGTETTTIEVLNSAQLVATPASQTICSGETADIAITGDNGATVNWSTDTGLSGTGTTISEVIVNNGTANQTTTFTITAKDGNCYDTIEATVDVKPNPSVISSPKSSVICDFENLNVTLSSPLSGTVINWVLKDDTGATVAFGNDTDTAVVNVPNLDSGDYTLEYTGTNNGCTSQTYTLPVTVN